MADLLRVKKVLDWQLFSKQVTLNAGANQFFQVANTPPIGNIESPGLISGTAHYIAHLFRFSLFRNGLPISAAGLTSVAQVLSEATAEFYLNKQLVWQASLLSLLSFPLAGTAGAEGYDISRSVQGQYTFNEPLLIQRAQTFQAQIIVANAQANLGIEWAMFGIQTLEDPAELYNR